VSSSIAAKLPAPPLLLWRGESLSGTWLNNETPHFRDPTAQVCSWCRSATSASFEDERDACYSFRESTDTICPVCGWFASYEYDFESGGPDDRDRGLINAGASVAILQEYAYDDPQVAADELASFIRINPSALPVLSPRRFEEIVAAAYGGSGFDVALTAASHDGGVDVVCVDSRRSTIMIVECKHRQSGKSIGVRQVRELMGAMIDWDARSAALVTSGTYSRPAEQLAAVHERGASSDAGRRHGSACDAPGAASELAAP
jgi:Restriction endonuclease